VCLLECVGGRATRQPDVFLSDVQVRPAEQRLKSGRRQAAVRVPRRGRSTEGVRVAGIAWKACPIEHAVDASVHRGSGVLIAVEALEEGLDGRLDLGVEAKGIARALFGVFGSHRASRAASYESSSSFSAASAACCLQ